MPSTWHLTLSKWALDVATRIVRSKIRLHNAAAVSDGQAIVFVVNHFTRLETLLLPYVLHRHTGMEVSSLAAAELFQGPVGEFLRNTGTISTKDPDRDKTIVHSLLTGAHPWMIFPEGAMIKDKKVIDHHGEFQVYNDGRRRPPHTGAGVLALRAEFYREKIRRYQAAEDREALEKTLALFNLDTPEPVLNRRTVIIPVNITYFPVRATRNALLRLADRIIENLDPRAIEELSVEGTVLAEDTDIDITLGDPIPVRNYLSAPDFAPLAEARAEAMPALEREPQSPFNTAARKLMRRYMREIYQMTTLNLDHVLATMLRHQRGRQVRDRVLRHRVFLAVRKLQRQEKFRLHPGLAEQAEHLLFDENCRYYDDFMAVCVREGLLAPEGRDYVVVDKQQQPVPAFHEIRMKGITAVVANEFEPVPGAVETVHSTAHMPAAWAARKVRRILAFRDQRRFEEDYARRYDTAFSKGPEVGRPFLLRPAWVRGGVVLSHGYMAAPLEVRALANYLYRNGFAVYGVRLRGHGTSPEDLAHSRWEEWYDSLNLGYAVLRTFTEDIFFGGFSTGGCLALMAAARKGPCIRGLFSICAPVRLQNYSVRLAPSIVSLNALLKRIGRVQNQWEYVENNPENKHINYLRNPIAGVNELVQTMHETERLLPQVRVPALVIQASKDPTVNPASGPQIFEQLGTIRKELAVFERERHGIINGEGSEEVFERVFHFLRRTLREPQPVKTGREEDVAAGPETTAEPEESDGREQEEASA